MSDHGFRAPDASEHRVFERLFEIDFPGRNELSKQLDGMLVRKIDIEGSLELRVKSPILASVTHRIPVEARYSDLDTQPGVGPYVNVLLHVVDGRMVELEYFKDDNSPIKRKSCARDLEVSVR